MAGDQKIKIVSTNRKARHNYHLSTTYDAGLVLMGSEIKSIRANRVNLGDSFIQEREGELWLVGAHIALYPQASVWGHSDPMRPRKLLLHKREIARILSTMRERGQTVVPTKLYLQNGRAKVEIALAKGKKLYDKRESIAKRDSERQIRRALKEDL